MIFDEPPVFKKEFKKYKKKYKSLDQDLDKIKKVLKIFPCGNGEKHWSNLIKTEDIYIFKVRLSCAYLKKNSLRLIYVYREKDNRIDFLEIFFKGDKAREDKKRIEEYLRNIK
jgi:hypothetical protein